MRAAGTLVMDQGTFGEPGVNLIQQEPQRWDQSPSEPLEIWLPGSKETSTEEAQVKDYQGASAKYIYIYIYICISISKWIAAHSLPVLILINLHLSSVGYFYVEGKRRKVRMECAARGRWLKR